MATITSPKSLQAALRYAQAGLPVLPVWGLRGANCACPKGARCPAPGKHPIEANWPKRASTNTKQVREWFTKHPDAHVGVMARPGGFFLDVDPRNGGTETLKALMNGSKVPSTPTQESGGGGWHFEFAGEPPGKLGKGLDVKAHGTGFVVAWPSGHASGGEYKWKPGREPWKVKPMPAPKWLRAAPRTSNTKAASAEVPPIETVRAALAHCSADDYETWVKYGQALRRSYGDAGRAVWVEWSKTSSKWQDGDEAKWDTFDKNLGIKPVTVASILADARTQGFAPEFGALPDATPASGARPVPTIEVQRSTEIAARELPPVREFVPKLLTAGLTVIFGRAKLGKSWLMLQLARAVPNGGEFLGKRTAQARLLYLALEDNERRMKARIAKLGMTQVEFGVAFRAPRVDQDLAGALASYIEKDKYEVIVIDTLAAISPASHGKKGVWSGEYSTMDKLQKLAAKYNVAILVVSHAKKNSDHIDPQDAHMGTTGMLAGVDASWVIQRRAGGTGGEGRMVLTVRGRDIEEEEYALRFDRETTTWQMLGRAGQVVYSQQQQEILQTLRVSGQPQRHAELKRACNLGANFNPSLARLVRKGLVEQDAKGRYRIASMEDILG